MPPRKPPPPTLRCSAPHRTCPAPVRAAQKIHPQIPSRWACPSSPSSASECAAADRRADNRATPRTPRCCPRSPPAPRRLPDNASPPAARWTAARNASAKSKPSAAREFLGTNDTARTDQAAPPSRLEDATRRAAAEKFLRSPPPRRARAAAEVLRFSRSPAGKDCAVFFWKRETHCGDLLHC